MGQGHYVVSLTNEQYDDLIVDKRERDALRARVTAIEAELKALGEQLDGARKCVSDDAFTRYNEPFAYYHERISDGMGLWLKGDDRRVAGYRLVCKLYDSPAPQVPDGVADALLSYLTHIGCSLNAGEEQRLRAMLSAAQAKEGKP